MNSGQTFAFLMTALICTTVACLAIASAVIKSRGKSGKHPDLEVEFNDRLGRMEHAIDAIAVEVERVSEAQRFVAKVMADRKAPAAIPERVNTPR